MKSTNNNSTINYYNINAEEYYKRTINADVSELRNRFIKHLNPNGRVIDIGAGSGRDMIFFRTLGYEVDGIDASEELCNLVYRNTGMSVENSRIQEWKPEKQYDGIWACASLVHLSECEILDFIKVATNALNEKGVLFLSMKEEIDSGYDENGRFFINFTNELLEKILRTNKELELVDDWYSDDTLSRVVFRWRNIIAVKCNMKK